MSGNKKKTIFIVGGVGLLALSGITSYLIYTRREILKKRWGNLINNDKTKLEKKVSFCDDIKSEEFIEDTAELLTIEESSSSDSEELIPMD